MCRILLSDGSTPSSVGAVRLTGLGRVPPSVFSGGCTRVGCASRWAGAGRSAVATSLVAMGLRPAGARPRQRGRADVRPAAADPAAAFLVDVVPARPVRGGRRPARRCLGHFARRGARAVDDGARPVRAGRPRSVVRHLRGVPEPQVASCRSSTGTCGTGCWRGRRPAHVVRPRPRRGAPRPGSAPAGPLTSCRSSTSHGSSMVPASLVVALVWSRRRPGRRVVRHRGRGRLGARGGDLLRRPDARADLRRPRRRSRTSRRTRRDRRCRQTMIDERHEVLVEPVHHRRRADHRRLRVPARRRSASPCA